MNDKTPCHCQERQAFGVAEMPSVADFQSALALAQSAGPGTHLQFGAETAPAISDPLLAASPTTTAAAPAAGDLQALIAIARANPGLKITLWF